MIHVKSIACGSGNRREKFRIRNFRFQIRKQNYVDVEKTRNRGHKTHKELSLTLDLDPFFASSVYYSLETHPCLLCAASYAMEKPTAGRCGMDRGESISVKMEIGKRVLHSKHSAMNQGIARIAYRDICSQRCLLLSPAFDDLLSSLSF
jgi:hypothetical protein